MGKVDFIEIGSLGNYIGKGGKIIIDELMAYPYEYMPVTLIKSDGEEEGIQCSEKLTKLIQKDFNLVFSLPYFIVIETKLKRKSISINSVNKGCLNLSDYIIEVIPMSETIDLMRKEEEEFLRQKKENKK